MMLLSGIGMTLDVCVSPMSIKIKCQTASETDEIQMKNLINSD
jgi:hypothetical protein